MKKIEYFVYAFIATTVLLTASCQAFFDTVKESFTTVVAKYVENGVGGIEIKDFEKDAKLEKAGLIDEDGIVPKSFTFNKPDMYDVGGIMSCNELPLDFVKISNEAGKRSIKPSKYAGTWEAIVPMPQGFRKIFLDLKSGGNCSIYFDLYPNDDVEVKTRKETVLQGKFSPSHGYILDNIYSSSTGYKKSMKRFAGCLEDINNTSDLRVLFAKFKVAGQFNFVRMFELKEGTIDKGTYFGDGDFSEEKVGKKITFEIDRSNFSFKLTIPEGTKLPKKFNK